MKETDLSLRDPSLTQIDPFESSSEVMLVIAFPKSTSKNYSMAAALAQQAGKCQSGLIGTTEMTIASFMKTERDAKIARSLISYVSSWKGSMLICDGVSSPYWHDVVQTLSCYLESCGCRDYRAHCVEIIDDPFRPPENMGGFFISSAPIKTKTVEIARYAFPCSLLLRDMAFQRGHPSSPQDQIQAAAVKERIHICPRFNPDSFQEAGIEEREVDDN